MVTSQQNNSSPGGQEIYNFGRSFVVIITTYSDFFLIYEWNVEKNTLK